MHKQKGVSNHSAESYRQANLGTGGIPPQKPGSWLSRKLKAWKGQATDFLRSHGILPNKPIHRRQVDESVPPHQIIVIEEDIPKPPPLPPAPVVVTEKPTAPPPQPKAHKKHTETMAQNRRRRRQRNFQQQQSQVGKYLLEKPCEFALKCIDEEKPIPNNFVSHALKPGLRMTWGNIAGIPPQQADRMVDSLVNSFGLEGLDVDEQFLDSYENSSRYAPLSPEQKFNLILKLNQHLTTPEAQQNFGKILDALEYYQSIQGKHELPKADKQVMMGSVAEYLINHAQNLPPLTSKGLAACAHFNKYIESVQYQVIDIPAEMVLFMEYMSNNPETFAAMTPSGIAASYIFDAEFEGQKEHLPDPFQPDSE